MDLDYTVSENFCTVFDQMIADRISKLEFDITKICTIVDIARHKEGYYLVKEGVAIFEAFSENTSYEKGDSVFVTIPKGDYSSLKMIVGKTSVSDATLPTYKAPLQEILPVRIIAHNDKIFTLQTNKSTPVCIFSGTAPDIINEVDNFVFSTGIKAQLSTLNSEGDLIAGNYGFKIYFIDSIGKSYEFSFDSKEMIGNPYSYETTFRQQKRFNIKDLKDISSYSIWFYQNNNFAVAEENIMEDYILMTFGFEKSQFSSDTVVISARDLTYNSKKTSEQITLRWVHIDDNKEPVLMNKSSPNLSDYDIEWYEKNKNKWEKILDISDLFYPIIAFNLLDDKKIIKVVIKKKEPKEDESFFFTSNELIFKNTTTVDEIIERKEKVTFSIAKNDQQENAKSYFIYDQENNLIPSFYGTRILTASVAGVKNIGSCKWIYPTVKTQLAVDTADRDPANTLSLSFIPKYFQENTDNKIMCEITDADSGIIYTGSLDFTFGRKGTNGSDYTLMIDLEIKTKDQAVAEALLYDKFNQKVEIPAISWELINSEYHSLQDLGNNVCLLTQNSSFNYTKNSAILKATVQIDSLKLYAVSAIPAFNLKYKLMFGAKEVIYNAFGSPEYSKSAYALYDKDGQKVKNIKWQLFTDEASKDFFLRDDILVAPNMYLSNYSTAKITICALEKSGVYLWSQPIIISQNKYGFSMLNSWNSQLTFDEKNGTILSSMLCAGKKVNNLFSGVLIGDVKNNNSNNQNTGIYGFKDGVITYQLTDDGRAEFGNADIGSIIIDGKGSTIKSSNYMPSMISTQDYNNLMGTEKNKYIVSPSNPNLYFKTEGQGLYIDLKKGYIDAGTGFFRGDISGAKGSFRGTLEAGYANGQYQAHFGAGVGQAPNDKGVLVDTQGAKVYGPSSVKDKLYFIATEKGLRMTSSQALRNDVLVTPTQINLMSVDTMHTMPGNSSMKKSSGILVRPSLIQMQVDNRMSSYITIGEYTDPDTQKKEDVIRIRASKIIIDGEIVKLPPTKMN